MLADGVDLHLRGPRGALASSAARGAARATWARAARRRHGGSSAVPIADGPELLLAERAGAEVGARLRHHGERRPLGADEEGRRVRPARVVRGDDARRLVGRERRHAHARGLVDVRRPARAAVQIDASRRRERARARAARLVARGGARALRRGRPLPPPPLPVLPAPPLPGPESDESNESCEPVRSRLPAACGGVPGGEPGGMKSSTLRRSHVVTRPSAQKMARRRLARSSETSSGAFAPFARASRPGPARRAIRTKPPALPLPPLPPSPLPSRRRPRAVADDHRDVPDEVERPQRDRAVARPDRDEPRARALVGARASTRRVKVRRGRVRVRRREHAHLARAERVARAGRTASRRSGCAASPTAAPRRRGSRRRAAARRLDARRPARAPAERVRARVAARARARADERRAVLAHDDEPRRRRPRRGRRLRRAVAQPEQHVRVVEPQLAHVADLARDLLLAVGPRRHAPLGGRGRRRAQPRLAPRPTSRAPRRTRPIGARVHLDASPSPPS